MNRRLTGLLWAPLALFGSLLMLRAETAPSTEGENPTLLEYLEWRSDSGKTVARGLVVSRSESEESHTRAIMVTPKDNHVILTAKANWQQGELSVKFLDEESNWWSELTTTMSLSDLDGKDFNEVAQALKKLETGEAWEEQSFLSCDGFFWQEMASPGRDEPANELLPAAFAGSDHGQNVPNTAGEEASFLLAFSNTRELALGHDAKAMLLTVMKAAGTGDLYARQPWTVETPLGLVVLEPGVDIDPSIGELLSEFRTVLAENPLHDRR